ncbi:MAG: transporter [Alphaproteobacteria bacterium]|nr:transporter [Alphaproteobacteria bacterium]
MSTSPKRTRHRGAGAFLAAALICATAVTSKAFAAAETFNTALPVARGDFVYRQQILVMEASGDPTPLNRDERAWGGVSVLGYGVTPDFTLFAILPYLDKRVDFMMGGARVDRSTSGIGDALLLGRYTLLSDNVAGRTFRISTFAGVKLPTGRDDATDRLGRLPRDLQLGSGSWDGIAGVIATWQTLDYQIDAQAQYKVNTGADGFRFSDEARLDASFQYRLWPRTLGTGVPGFLYGVVEANLIHHDRNRIGGLADPNSGGTTLFLDPGLQYVTRRWVLEAIVQLPAAQDLNGTAVKSDYSLLFGFRVNL